MNDAIINRKKLCMNEISYFCIVNETKTLCLLVAVSLKFQKQNERKKLYEYFRHEWIFQERIGGKDNMYIPLYACVHLFMFVCFMCALLCTSTAAFLNSADLV